MRIKEVRNIIKNYSEEELRILLTEMYKAIPKTVKEEKDIDQMVEDINSYKNSRRRVSRQKEDVNIELLEYEVETFIEYAYKQYYFAPNSFVHKKERPKWRFKVSKYIKQLDKVENNELVIELLEKIYEVLCYGCHYVIFSSDDPFASIRISQEDVFNRIVRRKFADGFKREAITSTLKLMAANKPADSLLPSLLQYINTPDSRLITIEECNKLQQMVKNGHKLTSNKLEKSNSGRYYTQEKINILVETAFYCYLELSEYETAGEYFMSNYEGHDDEVKLYILLRLLYESDLKENWLSEYEKAIQGGIKPRERLTKMYEYIIKENKLPDYMY
jgi:hypothetical protein